MRSLHQNSLAQPVAALGDVQVVVIAKEPLAGAVKTRLCPPLTPVEAARVAAAALADTLDVVRQSNCRARVVAFEGESDQWVPGEFIVVPQRQGPFGERLAGAIDDAWAGYGFPMLLIGMDTPQVCVSDLERAAAALLAPGVDAVLGPADDGGYWLIGVRRPEPGMFADVAMSTDHTASDQLGRLGALGLRCTVIHRLRDVDTVSDACAVAELAPNTSFAVTLRACAFNAVEPNSA